MYLNLRVVNQKRVTKPERLSRMFLVMSCLKMLEWQLNEMTDSYL